MRPFLLLLLLAFTVTAQMEGNPANWCRSGFFTRDSTKFETAKADPSEGGRAYFYSDDRENCPNDVSCKGKAFIIKGDEVVLNRVFGNFACAWFTPSKGMPTVGWLRLKDLARSNKTFDTSEKAWIGEWSFGENSIKLTPNKLAGFLNIVGDAYWKGVGDNIHIGELDGRAEPKNGILKYSDGDDEFDCKATLNLVGTYLVVADNLKCGGVNVSFSGIYIRKKKY